MKPLKWLLVIAVLGLAAVVFAVIDTNRVAQPTAPTTATTSKPPFASYVSGSGLTENGRGNVAIATSIAGVVSAIDVRVGDSVAAGAPLFRIDDRDAQARLQVARANVAKEQAAQEKLQHQYDYLQRMDKLGHGAISAQALTAARDDAIAAQASVKAAQADVQQLESELQRLVVRSPITGRILQVNIRVGESADNTAAQPLMLVGDDSRMFLRVNIDENDAWRVRPDARAIATLRGNPTIHIPLHFEYIEPYVRPKPSLNGQATERPDVRALQVVYSFPHDQWPVYLGEQMDAAIEAAPAGNGAR